MIKNNTTIEKYRVTPARAEALARRYKAPGIGGALSNDTYGNAGAFIIPLSRKVIAYVLVGDGLGWEHVSVSLLNKKRTPTWEEMSQIKDLFWESDETVLQYHPPKSQYINHHEYVLHLWRPVETEVPMPPLFLV